MIYDYYKDTQCADYKECSRCKGEIYQDDIVYQIKSGGEYVCESCFEEYIKSLDYITLATELNIQYKKAGD